MEGSLLKADAVKYNKLDNSIKEAMLAAEKRLPKQCKQSWTREINILVHQVKY